MAGRGRGGKSMSINVEALGFGRGDALPTATIQPPPLYPTLTQLPLPLEHGDKYSYLVDLKRDFQTFMEDSIFYVKLDDQKKDIDRYSDKYKLPTQSASDQGLLLMSRMPEELQASKSKKSKEKLKSARENMASTAVRKLQQKEDDDGDASDDGEKSEGNKSDENSDQMEEEDLDEDDLEEENDYVHEYFDNGEQFGDADDGEDDGPFY